MIQHHCLVALGLGLQADPHQQHLSLLQRMTEPFSWLLSHNFQRSAREFAKCRDRRFVGRMVGRSLAKEFWNFAPSVRGSFSLGSTSKCSLSAALIRVCSRQVVLLLMKVAAMKVAAPAASVEKAPGICPVSKHSIWHRSTFCRRFLVSSRFHYHHSRYSSINSISNTVIVTTITISSQ